MVAISLVPARGEPPFLVPVGQEVRITIEREISSATAVKGQTFPIRLAEPIVVNGLIIVPAGTTGEGQVVHASRAKGAGKPGELILAARFLEHGGARILLRGFDFQQVGKDRNEKTTTAAVILGTAFGVGGGLATFFIKGGEIVVPAGTTAVARLAAGLPAQPPQLPDDPLPAGSTPPE